ncbi:MAG: NAD+ synthase [Planctomycetes bacterium]|nr:NAD+ synthase [Planctomycetota bacterium]
MKLALAQHNPTIGDIAGNTTAILTLLEQATAAAADLVVFPEQAILCYPAKDLLLRQTTIAGNVAALERIAQRTTRTAVLVGYAEPNETSHGRPVFNTAALLVDGRIRQRWRKRLLPTYDVFDEARYFEPAGSQPVFDFRGLTLGATICEDMWCDETLLTRPLYACDPVAELARAGARLVINISASPYTYDRHAGRVELMAAHARRHNLPMAYVNQVGGNDELLFDGASCFVDAEGQLAAQAKAFVEDVTIVDLDNPLTARRERVSTGVASVHDALLMGIRDYVRKCGFESVLIGLSGGIDSAVVAALACAALGPEKVRGVAMPSRYSSRHSVADAQSLAANLRMQLDLVEIEPMHAAFEHSLLAQFAGRPPDVTEENIQARVRGGILMAMSNKLGNLLLTTGNKSELAVGYCTLYGDMCGGLAVISDVPKAMVYALARYMNEQAGRAVIPESTLTKPPSAELCPDQTDQDSLPPYDVLDAILQRYEERLESVDTIVAAGFERATVLDIVRKIHINEYKRQQAAPGLKVTTRAFGFGRRMPIAARPPH